MRTFLNMGLVKASSEKTRQPAAPLIAQAPRRAAAPKIAAVPTPKRVPPPLAEQRSRPHRHRLTPPPPDQAAMPPPAAPPSAPTVEIARVRSVLVGSAQPGLPNRLQSRAIRRLRSRQPRLRRCCRSGPQPRAWLRLRPPPHRRTSRRRSPISPSCAARRPRRFDDAGLQAGARRAARCRTGHDRGAACAAAAWPRAASSLRARRRLSRAGFQIQIGAFQSAAEADRKLAAVRERAGGLLAGGTPVTLPVQQGQKSFFRARYSGFDASAAAKACDELKRLKIDCLVVKAE